MNNLMKFCTSLAIILSLISSASAIDIEPEHDAMAYDINDIAHSPAITPPKTLDPIAPSIAIEGPRTIAPIPPAIKREALPTMTASSTKSPQAQAPTLQSQGQRIYYARSVTSNNPEYKTRFSILHNTPSPKRIGGERLYNLSESFFRLAVDGNKIAILDNPVFNLVGINSAKGRYGEIKVLDGAVLNIHGTSKRFKGKWDLDGTGERNLKITPTNLVSGTIPVHYKTFEADGSVVTDEIHELYFKAMAMGPYNGYWSDGADIGIFLWGMSAAKLKSKEMAYLGLDLGIVTHNSPETTGSTVAPALSNNAAIVPIAPIIAAAPSEATSSIMPFGGGNYNPAPFIGGFSGGFGGGFGGGFIGGGGGGTSTVINNNEVINNNNQVINNNNNEVINNGGEVINNNNQVTNNNQIINNGGDVVNNNNQSNDVINNNIINNIDNSGGCLVNNNNNTVNQGVDSTITNSGSNNANGNTVSCVANNDICTTNPNHPICNPDNNCEKNPLAPGCDNFCERNPRAPKCCALHPERCDPVDPCAENPASLHCNPSTPVSEPFAPLALFAGLIGYLVIRRRRA